MNSQQPQQQPIPRPMSQPPRIEMLKAARHDFMVGWLRGQLAAGEDHIPVENIRAMLADAESIYMISGFHSATGLN